MRIHTASSLKEHKMDKTGGIWRMVAAMAMSGTIGVFVLGSGQSPLTVVFFRCLIGALALLGWLARSGGWRTPDRPALAWIALGAAALIGNWLCLFAAFSLAGISVATVVYHVQPFILVLLAALVQREPLERRKLPWLLLAFAGVALTTGMSAGGGQAALAAGVLLALAAAFLYALATLATRKLKAYAPAQIAGLQLALGVLVLAPLVRVDLHAVGAAGWGSLLVVGLVHTGLVYNLMYGAFQRLRADTIASLSFIYPLVAMGADYLVFGTRLGPMQWAGVGLILLSLAGSQTGWTFRIRPGPSGCRGKFP
jgi:drug/metabolite transporter (DMT)-like permease